MEKRVHWAAALGTIAVLLASGVTTAHEQRHQDGSGCVACHCDVKR